ncbi:hypothetical protein V8E52_007431 [Russula decolorans]
MNVSPPQDPSDHKQLNTCPPTHNIRPASPFFRHRPLGRAPSPPTWACYEQIPARSDLLGSSDSDSDSGEVADEDSLSDADSSSSSSASSDEDDEEHEEAQVGIEADPQPAEAEAAGLMDVESDKDEEAAHRHPASGDPEKRDKGKQRADDPPNTVSGGGGGKSVPVSHSRSRRPRGRRPPVSVLRPILTIQRSQGFVWNQDLFVPPYIKDRYVASTSPPTSYGPFSACGSTSTSTPSGDYEIEVVEIRVRDGELNDIIP